MSSNPNKLSLLGHIEELRRRLIRSVAAVAVTTTLSFVLAKQIFDILTFKSSLVTPVFNFLTNKLHLFPPPNLNLVFIDITEMIGTYMKVCLISCIILATPYITYEVAMFISPALTPQERRRFIYTALPWVGLMFVIGVLFTYFILLPPATSFMVTFGSDIATPQIRIENYVATITRLLLAVGLIFELPVVATVLARFGIIQPKWLASKRKWAIILAFVLGGIITPTLDPVNQTLVSLPLILLYEMSIWLTRLVYKRKPAS